MDTVTFRQITNRKDLDPIIAIAADSWIQDPYFSHLVPGREKNPQDFYYLWKHIITLSLYETGKVIFVAERYESGVPVVIGFAIWQRRGTSSVAKSWRGDGLSRKLTRLSLHLNFIFKYITTSLKTSLPFSRLVSGLKESSKVHDLWPTETWGLCLLGVSKKHQGQGIGKKLLRWGLKTADEEGVPLVLEASEAGAPLYEKVGFRGVGWMVFDEGRQRQALMIRDAHL